MEKSLRFLISFLGFIATYIIVVTIVLSNLWPHGGYLMHDAIALITALTVAVFLFIKLQNVSKELTNYILKGGLITGGICFILGFIGPLIFYPSANDGPLLGILITGPLGFLVGMLGGGFYWIFKTKAKKDKIVTI